MSEIEWTDETWNPTRGCRRVSPGCEHCYAEKIAARFSGPGQPFEGFAEMTPSGPRWTGKVALIPERLKEPLHWRKPRRVFVNSMSDLFHEGVGLDNVLRVFDVMARAPLHTFQVLTKRPLQMEHWLNWHRPGRESFRERLVKMVGYDLDWPLPNVWLGVSVEDQKTADERLGPLLLTPAAKRFVSYEPGLNGINLGQLPNSAGLGEGQPWVDALKGLAWVVSGPDYYDQCSVPGLDWVIVGGESGPHARGFDVSWARSMVQACREAGVACFVKQLGSRAMENGERLRLSHSKGGDPSEWPEDLRVREWPDA